IAYPCTGSRATILRINRSSVPCGKSDFSCIAIPRTSTYVPRPRVEVQGVDARWRDDAGRRRRGTRGGGTRGGETGGGERASARVGEGARAGGKSPRRSLALSRPLPLALSPSPRQRADSLQRATRSRFEGMPAA